MDTHCRKTTPNSLRCSSRNEEKKGAMGGMLNGRCIRWIMWQKLQNIMMFVFNSAEYKTYLY